MINTSTPNWEYFNDNNLALLPPPSTNCSPPSESPMLRHGLSELTWVNGQLAMHGFDTAKRMSSAATTVTHDDNNWPKMSCNGTLEAIVDQAHRKVEADDHVPWFMAPYAAVPKSVVVAATAAAATTAIPSDARVPCSGSSQNLSSQVLGGTGGGRCVVGSSTRVESCSAGTFDNRNGKKATKRAKLAATLAAAAEYSSRDNSVSGTMDSQQITLDTCDWDVDVQGGFSLGSPGNTSSGNKTIADDRDSVGVSRPQRGAGDEKEKKKGAGGKASISTKRSRAAAVHNQSERKRRDKINDRMRTLQKLVPHSSKTDKASVLDEVIDYLKNLQAQINMMSRMGMSPMNMNPMMMPMAMQQQMQMQMQMMSQMGMGMGMNPMGMGMNPMGMMDLNAMGRPNIHPNPYMPMQQPQWDMTTATANAAGATDRVLPAPAGPTLVPSPPGPPLLPDPISASLLAFQSQPMTLEGYNKMAAMFHQMNQMPASGTKG